MYTFLPPTFHRSETTRAFAPLPWPPQRGGGNPPVDVRHCLPQRHGAFFTPSNPATETYAAALGVNIAGMTKISNDLYVQDLVVGTGATAAAGSAITVTYSGWLTSGYLFDSNVGKTAFPLTLGAVPGVIDGWDLGLVGVKAGGKRRLVIGSNLGYGGAANGPIPANSTLVFDVTVLTVK